jgi:methionyl-tRNA formyltransferase
MKIGFFGTPEISSCCLEDILKHHEVLFVVTAEDKPYGRNRKIRFCPTKDLALCREIDILQPSDLSDPEFIEHLKSYNADIFVVVAYGLMIPEEVFTIPPLKSINLHPSLLPKYRGAAPIQWALINGEEETGVTVQMISSRMDAGDIVVQERISLNEDMTSAGLYESVIEISGDLLNRAIVSLAEGRTVPVKQDESEASYCGKIERETAHIDWSLPSESIHNLVRGLNPKPVAWTTFRGKNMKIWTTSLLNEDTGLQLKPGQLAKFMKKKLIAGTGRGVLEITGIQPENKKLMDGHSFINGYRIGDTEEFLV